MTDWWGVFAAGTLLAVMCEAPAETLGAVRVGSIGSVNARPPMGHTPERAH